MFVLCILPIIGAYARTVVSVDMLETVVLVLPVLDCRGKVLAVFGLKNHEEEEQT